MFDATTFDPTRLDATKTACVDTRMRMSEVSRLVTGRTPLTVRRL